METQEILEIYAKNVADQLVDVTDDVLARFEEYCMADDDETADDYVDVANRIVAQYGHEINEDFNFPTDCEDFEYMNDLLKAIIVTDLKGRDAFGKYIYKINRNYYDGFVKEYQNTFGIDYERLSNNIIKPMDWYTAATPQTDIYLVSAYKIESDMRPMDLISNINRSLFLGYDQFDSIHQPEFNNCAMYKYVQYQAHPEELVRG